MSSDVTVYLDEAGSFQTERGEPWQPPWVVGGYFIIGDRARQESSVSHCLRRELRTISELAWFREVKRQAGEELERDRLRAQDARSRSRQEENEDDSARQLPVDLSPPLPPKVKAALRWLVNFDPNDSILHRTEILRAIAHLEPNEVAQRISAFDQAIVAALSGCGFFVRRIAAVNARRNAKFDFTNYSVLLGECVSAICTEIAATGVAGEGPKVRFVIADRWSPDADSRDRLLHGQRPEFLSQYVTNAVASGLASVGASELLGTHDDLVTFASATDSLQLGVADMLCGQIRRLFLDNFLGAKETLERNGFVISFLDESALAKRTRTAQAEGDVAGEVLVHLQTLKSESAGSSERSHGTAIKNCLRRQLAAESPRAFYHLIDSLIERLDRWCKFQSNLMGIFTKV